MAPTKHLKYFIIEENEVDKTYKVRINHTQWKRDISDGGSYIVLIARLFGLSLAGLYRTLLAKYPDQLTIYGKNAYYGNIIWKDKSAAREFAQICDAKLERLF